jgi:hypothetical protein
VNNFIQENHFIKINTKPTRNYQRTINQTLTQCKNIIPIRNKWRYTNINPTAPNLHATIKLDKYNTPIRPAIN